MAKYTGGYAGSWAKGFASTFAQAPSMIFNALQWKEKKKEKEKIDKAADEFKLNAAKFATQIDNAFKDGTITQQEYTDITSFGIILGSEYTKEWENLYKNYTEMTSKEIDSQLETIKYAVDKWETLGMGDTKALMGVLDEIGNSTKYDKVKYQVDYLRNAINSREQVTPEVFPTAEALREKYPKAGVKYTEKGYVPTFAEPAVAKIPGITDYNTAAAYLSKFKDAPPETFNKVKAGFQSQFPDIDMSSITQESLKKPEEPTPEGEITAGEKRTYDMASSIMFGSSDWVTGISKPGIISTMISNKLNMGQPLTDEEKAEVRNNYNTIKGTLPEEVISAVESQLKRYGIPLVEPTPTITPTPTPEPEPKKWWEFWKEGTKPTTPEVTPEVTPGITPTAEKIPTPKVPTGAKEALIPTMTKKELEDAIKDLDPSDPLYKIIYDEAVKRGYITK